jgi:lipid-A-disaccharide synthase
VPTVVAHKVSALSAWLIRRMALIPFVSLVNIVAKKEILPELLQERWHSRTYRAGAEARCPARYNA